VTEESIHERLRLARMAAGVSVESLAKRSGMRAEWFYAIDTGRFEDLPAGIYARAAVRAYAAALNLDGDEILRSGEALLPPAGDPIDAMRRARGMPSISKALAKSKADATLPRGAVPDERPHSMLPDWRLLAAAIIDAGAMAVGLLFLVTCTVAIGLPLHALDRVGAAALFGVMCLLAAMYFVVFGGILGQTVGEYVAGTPSVPPPAKLTLDVVATRTRHAIIRDWSFVARLGEWLGRTTASHWHWPTSSAFAAIAGFTRHHSRED
jgi:transcriptional regulator with XRE-family HTH domain